ncbi:hypothetical protein ACX8XN_05985 [Calditrichota bacterium GD2]
MNRIDFIKNFLIILSCPILFKKLQNSSKIFAEEIKSTSWQITDDCTSCGMCYEDYNEDFEEGDDSAIFKEGHWFNHVWDNGKMANCGTEYYEKVQEVADNCPANAIIEIG